MRQKCDRRVKENVQVADNYTYDVTTLDLSVLPIVAPSQRSLAIS